MFHIPRIQGEAGFRDNMDSAMAQLNEIGTAFADRMRAGPLALVDAQGQPAVLELPLGDGDTIELGVNPQHGFFLRRRAPLDRLADVARAKLLSDLVRLTATARLGRGWVGGLEGGEVVTLMVPINAGVSADTIARLIDTAGALLRPSTFEAREQIVADDLLIGEHWLRI